MEDKLRKLFKKMAIAEASGASEKDVLQAGGSEWQNYLKTKNYKYESYPKFKGGAIPLGGGLKGKAAAARSPWTAAVRAYAAAHKGDIKGNLFRDVKAKYEKKKGGMIFNNDLAGVMLGGYGTKVGAGKNKWVKFLKSYRLANPDVSGKVLFKQAAEAYKLHKASGGSIPLGGIALGGRKKSEWLDFLKTKDFLRQGYNDFKDDIH